MFQKTKQKFITFLKQGMTPPQLATAVSLGICIGTIPLLGATSILCMIAAFCFRLNMAAIQTVNFLIYPLQLVFYIPFLKAGAYIGKQEFDYSFKEISSMLTQHTWETIQKFSVINIYAIMLWLIIATIAYSILHLILRKSFQALAQTIHKDKKSEN